MQLDALKKHGCTTKDIFIDKASGARAKRPGLEACLEALQTHAPEEIAGTIIECSTEAQGAIPAAAEADTNGFDGKTTDAEHVPMFIEAP